MNQVANHLRRHLEVAHLERRIGSSNPHVDSRRQLLVQQLIGDLVDRVDATALHRHALIDSYGLRLAEDDPLVVEYKLKTTETETA